MMKSLLVLLVAVLVSGLAVVSDSGAKEASPSQTPNQDEEQDRAQEREMDGLTEEIDDLERDLDDIDRDTDEEEALESPEVTVPKGLENAAKKAIDDDDDITEIEISSETKQVEVKYRLRARLFGLIEVPYELQARVDAQEGTIEAQGPWWLLFASDNADDVQEALEADASLTTLSNQGTVLSRIISILKSIADR